MGTFLNLQNTHPGQEHPSRPPPPPPRDSQSCVFTYPLPVPQTPLMPAHWAYLDDDDDDRMTLADAMTIDARSTRSMKTLRPPENKKPGCYVQLKKLRPRDAFVSGILVKFCSLYLWWLHTCIRDWSLYTYGEAT